MSEKVEDDVDGDNNSLLGILNAFGIVGGQPVVPTFEKLMPHLAEHGPIVIESTRELIQCTRLGEDYLLIRRTDKRTEGRLEIVANTNRGPITCTVIARLVVPGNRAIAGETEIPMSAAMVRWEGNPVTASVVCLSSTELKWDTGSLRSALDGFGIITMVSPRLREALESNTSPQANSLRELMNSAKLPAA